MSIVYTSLFVRFIFIEVYVTWLSLLRSDPRLPSYSTIPETPHRSSIPKSCNNFSIRTLTHHILAPSAPFNMVPSTNLLYPFLCPLITCWTSDSYYNILKYWVYCVGHELRQSKVKRLMSYRTFYLTNQAIWHHSRHLIICTFRLYNQNIIKSELQNSWF